MNKLIFNDTEYDLVADPLDCNFKNTPFVLFNGNRYYGKAAPKEDWADRLDLANPITIECTTNDNLDEKGKRLSVFAIEENEIRFSDGLKISIEGFKENLRSGKYKLVNPQPTEQEAKDFVADNKPKDWEIQSIQHNGRNCWLQKDGRFKSELASIGTTAKSLFEVGGSIRSVKRLSDNAIFTLDEETEQGRIEKFFVGWNGMEVHFTNGGGETLGLVQKKKSQQEKPYTILSFSRIGNGKEKWVLKDGMYYVSDISAQELAPYPLERLLNGTKGELKFKHCSVAKGDVQIDSVRRNRDGERFEVGEKTTYGVIEVTVQWVCY